MEKYKLNDIIIIAKYFNISKPTTIKKSILIKKINEYDEDLIKKCMDNFDRIKYLMGLDRSLIIDLCKENNIKNVTKMSRNEMVAKLINNNIEIEIKKKDKNKVLLLGKLKRDELLNICKKYKIKKCGNCDINALIDKILETNENCEEIIELCEKNKKIKGIISKEIEHELDLELWGSCYDIKNDINDTINFNNYDVVIYRGYNSNNFDYTIDNINKINKNIFEWKQLFKNNKILISDYCINDSYFWLMKYFNVEKLLFIKNIIKYEGNDDNEYIIDKNIDCYENIYKLISSKSNVVNYGNFNMYDKFKINVTIFEKLNNLGKYLYLSEIYKWNEYNSDTMKNKIDLIKK